MESRANFRGYWNRDVFLITPALDEAIVDNNTETDRYRNRHRPVPVDCSLSNHRSRAPLKIILHLRIRLVSRQRYAANAARYSKSAMFFGGIPQTDAGES